MSNVKGITLLQVHAPVFNAQPGAHISIVKISPLAKGPVVKQNVTAAPPPPTSWKDMVFSFVLLYG